MKFTVQRSFYDAAQDNGFWSPSTSSANFCEEDYNVSHYVAELINTISNLAYIYYALYPPRGSLDALPSSTDPAVHLSWTLRRNRRNRTKWDLQMVALMLVGASSGIFHASLQMLPQYFDESSMYLLAASWIHALLTTTYVEVPARTETYKGKLLKRHKITRSHKLQTWLILATSLVLATVSSLKTGVLAIHSIIFALLLIVSGLKLLFLIIMATPVNSSPSFTRENILTMSKPRWILLSSLLRASLLLGLAFSLWLIDCNPTMCHLLRRLRNDVLGKTWYLQPLVYLTELHGWWHILTARSAGEYMALVRLLTAEN